MPANTETIKKGNLFMRMHLRHRIVASLIAALVAYLLIFRTSLDGLILSMIVWNAFALTFIITSWIVFFTRTSRQLRIRARQEDGSRLFVFLLILLSSFASLFAVLFLILSKDADATPRSIYVPVSVLNMLLSWVLVNTTFCFHYAHLYYDDSKDSTEINAGGLAFPQDKKPDYLDFVYFSFAIGTAFQVPDVDITSKEIRRIALLHGLISFGLNTFVVALAVNLIAGLRQ